MLPSKHHIDLCEGPLLGKYLQFYLPLLFTTLLQLLFNTADLIVIGRFGSTEAVAAIGTTASLSNLLINCFIGLSTGTTVIAAFHYGAQNDKQVSACTHTAIYLSLLCGILMGIVFFFSSGKLLQLMAAPPEVFSRANLYLRICSVGIPFLIIYNFGSAILRAVGDTHHPLVFLTISGLANVILNLLFVLAFHMEIAGVAWATVISQALSAVLVLRELTRTNDCCHLDFHQLRIDWKILRGIIKIGLPAGIGSCCFSLSNMIIQTKVNTLGTAAIAGNAIGNNIESYIYAFSYSYGITSISFTSQNLGRKLFARIKRCMFLSLTIGSLSCNLLGLLVCCCLPPILRLYTADPAVMEISTQRLFLTIALYALCTAMEVTFGTLRGLGYSLLPTFISLFFACLFRILWIAFVFPSFGSFRCIIASYPISWGLCALVNGLPLCWAFHKLQKNPDKLIAPTDGAQT